MTPSLTFPVWLEEMLLWIGGVVLVSVGVELKGNFGCSGTQAQVGRGASLYVF